MAPDPARVKEILQAVAEIGKTSDRAAFLDRECAGDTGFTRWMNG